MMNPTATQIPTTAPRSDAHAQWQRRVALAAVSILIGSIAAVLGAAPAQSATSSGVSWVQACFQLTAPATRYTPGGTAPYHTINSTAVLDYKFNGVWYVWGPKSIGPSGCVTVPVATGWSWRLRVNDYNSGFRYVAMTMEIYPTQSDATYWLGWYTVGSVWVR